MATGCDASCGPAPATVASPTMTRAAIAAARPTPRPAPGADRLAAARARMEATGQWHPRQSMGRRWPIGCVALEITQRCNLDCTLCYLSDSAEAVRDITMRVAFRERRMKGVGGRGRPPTGGGD